MKHVAPPTLMLDRKFSRSFTLHVLIDHEGHELGAWRYLTDVIDALVVRRIFKVIAQIDDDRYILTIKPLIEGPSNGKSHSAPTRL